MSKYQEVEKKYYVDKDLEEAINLINELILKQPNTINNYVLKSRIYKDCKKYSEAKTTIEDGFKIQRDNWKLNLLMAELLYDESNETNYNDALTKLNLSLDYISIAKMNLIKSQSGGGLMMSDNVINEKTLYEDRIYSLEKNVNHLIYIINVSLEINSTKNLIFKTEKLVYDERIRYIELFGLFVAIIAFIFSSISIFKEKQLLDSIILISALGLVLFIFMLGLHMAIFENARKNLKIVLFSFLFILFILPFVPNIINWINYLISKLGFFNIPIL